MIRERVDIHGRVRPMEPEDEIPALRLNPCAVGIIKEAPVRRWYEGQTAMDRKFESSARKIIKQRKKVEARVERMLTEAREAGLMLEHDREREAPPEINDAATGESSKPKRKILVRVASGQSGMSASTISSSVRIDEHRRYGPLDLDGESPPPSAIAGRRDTVRKESANNLFLRLTRVSARGACLD